MCAACHDGVDGYRDRLPKHLTPNVRENSAHRDSEPADLRNAGSLALTADKQRLESIRRGCLRTAMYPKHLLREDNVRDLVVYLGTLRGENR